MNDLDFLDMLTIISFWIQIQNQQNIVGIKDVQHEVDRAIDEIHRHLESQDEKIDTILEALNENHQRIS